MQSTEILGIAMLVAMAPMFIYFGWGMYQFYINEKEVITMSGMKK